MTSELGNVADAEAPQLGFAIGVVVVVTVELAVAGDWINEMAHAAA
jgi:hypothetical protein